MPELLVAFALGSALTWWLVGHRARPAPTPNAEPEQAQPQLESGESEASDDAGENDSAPRGNSPDPAPDPTAGFAERVGVQLANLTTGIEGHAQLLCEAIGDPARVATQAERLWLAVHKLRLFAEKIQWSTGRPRVALVPTDVSRLLGSLRHDLEEFAGGSMRVQCITGTAMPRALADEEILRKAILFVADALLELEPDARLLRLSASTRVDDDVAPSIELVIQVECEEHIEASSGQLLLGGAAAENLLAGIGAEVAFEHLAGLRATAVVSLLAAGSEPEPQPAPLPVEPMAPHPFGGVLVLERERSIRTMIQHEIARTGRRIVCCADGAGARALLEATPERFELLILDARDGTGHRLAADAPGLSPGAKVLVLTSDAACPQTPPKALPDRWKTLQKPFGTAELRRSLSHILQPLPEPDAAAGSTAAD